jgi:hypothetical protein
MTARKSFFTNNLLSLNFLGKKLWARMTLPGSAQEVRYRGLLEISDTAGKKRQAGREEKVEMFDAGSSDQPTQPLAENAQWSAHPASTAAVAALWINLGMYIHRTAGSPMLRLVIRIGRCLLDSARCVPT